jgi:hypothetical protein
VKMIVENQFFHGVVNMSTQIRGALEGLIFDKSLRLPEGGSGVLARRDVDKQRQALGSGGVSSTGGSGGCRRVAFIPVLAEFVQDTMRLQ